MASSKGIKKHIMIRGNPRSIKSRLSSKYEQSLN